MTELALLRLVAQGLAGPPSPTAAGTVQALTCVQAQDLPGALTSVALRTAGRSRADVVAALDDGSVVRSWPMRGTLHLLPAGDLPWFLEHCASRVARATATRRAQLGLTAADEERAAAAAVEALAGGRRLGRRALLGRFAEAGLDVTGQRGPHLLGHLAVTGLLCLGPMAGREQAFVLLAEWVPAPRRLGRDEGLAELAVRFLTSHGPATDADLARWSGLTLRDVRAGIAAVRAGLAAVEVDGREHLMAPDLPDRLAACRAEAEGVFLLPGFDEFVLGYADRGFTMPAAHADRIVPGGNGMFRSTVVAGGRVVGTWRWAGSGARRRVDVEPFEPLPAALAAAVAEHAARLPAPS
ncbi:winged helix DNA-binding domain-containing protein [Blastococcus sp. SYSU D00820]